MQNSVSYKPLIVLVAYFIWGSLPVYINWIQDVPTFIISVHRVIWALFIMLVILFFNRRLPELVKTVKKPKILAVIVFSGIMLGINWFMYVLSVELNRVVEASAGYYVYPSLTSFFGMLILKERFLKVQWVALVMVCISVIFYILSLHMVPYIAISLALSFSMYAISHKMLDVSFDIIFTLETIVLTILLGLYYLIDQHDSFRGMIPSWSNLLLLICFAGLSCLALYSFNTALKLIRISTLGMTFYLSPSLKMIAGIVFLKEVFSIEKAVFFLFIWMSVALYLYPIISSKMSKK